PRIMVILKVVRWCAAAGLNLSRVAPHGPDGSVTLVKNRHGASANPLFIFTTLQFKKGIYTTLCHFLDAAQVPTSHAISGIVLLPRFSALEKLKKRSNPSYPLKTAYPIFLFHSFLRFGKSEKNGEKRRKTANFAVFRVPIY
ncbi:MAG: hypothetical protein J6X87_03575, partial [Clostridia bacterium]|nr:hypothetical protein [Clostridia bacterium]